MPDPDRRCRGVAIPMLHYRYRHTTAINALKGVLLEIGVRRWISVSNINAWHCGHIRPLIFADLINVRSCDICFPCSGGSAIDSQSPVKILSGRRSDNSVAVVPPSRQFSRAFRHLLAFWLLFCSKWFTYFGCGLASLPVRSTRDLAFTPGMSHCRRRDLEHFGVKLE